MDNVYLLTGLYKETVQLDQLLHSIIIAVNDLDVNKITTFNFYWIIIIDPNSKWKSNTEVIHKNISRYRQLTIVNEMGVNSDNNPHYGGDIFNNFLINGSSHEEVPKPSDKDWIYILDDDNLVHPFLFLSLDECVESNHSVRLIWTTCKLSTGITRECSGPEAYLPDNNGWISSHRMMDPSQILVRYDLLKSIGFYTNGHDYDFTTGRLLWDKVKDNPESYCMYDTIDKGFGQDKWHSYWNGAVNLPTLNDWKNRVRYTTTAGELCLESWQCNTNSLKGNPTISIPLTKGEQLLLLNTLLEYRNKS
jgi:hypothetical protein